VLASGELLATGTRYPAECVQRFICSSQGSRL
jgi:hypothetical protein